MRNHAVANYTGAAVPMDQAAPLSSSELPTSTPLSARNDARRELTYRVFALPLALLVGRWVAGSGLAIVAGMLAMVVHESGHAITAWLAGRWAIPTFWVTYWGQQRSWMVVLIVTAAIAFGGFQAWRTRRWGWVCAAGVVLVVQVIFVSMPSFTQGAWIVFGGDGGAMVLGTILMATFYAPRESKFYQSWGLRWGFLAIGALSFMYVFHSWSGPYENIPFGEIEGVNLSDPSLLTTLYGWSIVRLVDRYLMLAKFCFAAMIAVYFWGLLSAYADLQVLKRRSERVEHSI
jgi:hypothetical protein